MSSIHELNLHHFVDNQYYKSKLIIRHFSYIHYLTIQKIVQMYNKQQLKPLNHKKIVNGTDPSPKPLLSKELSKAQSKQSPSPGAKAGLANKPANGSTVKPVKYERSGQRSTKTIEHYDCDDFGLELEDNNYFETQLEKNIKTEILTKTGKPQAKAQIVLPKLESDIKPRNMKDLEREMDEEMSKMMNSQYGNAYE